MKFDQRENGDIEVSEIDPFLVSLMVEGIRQEEEEWDCIADSFLAMPLSGDASFSQDWKEYAQPGLLTLFKSCHAYVLTDLENMKREQLNGSNNDLARLLIPVAHREAWLRILNVVRLSLTARHRLHDQEVYPFSKPDSRKIRPSSEFLLNSEEGQYFKEQHVSDMNGQEISGGVVPDLNANRGKAILQLQLFSVLQQILVEIESAGNEEIQDR